MQKKSVAAGLAVALGLGYAAAAFSQAKPETLVKQRQSAMTLQGKYLYSILPMAQDKIPFDGAVVARNAEYVDVLLKMPWDGFNPGTSGVKETRALPEIYKEEAKWKAAIERAQGESAKFVTVSKSKDVAAVKAQMTQLNYACNACHNAFRAKGN